MPGRVHLHRHRVTGASYPTGRCPLCSRTVEVETARVIRAASSPWHSGHTSGADELLDLHWCPLHPQARHVGQSPERLQRKV